MINDVFAHTNSKIEITTKQKATIKTEAAVFSRRLCFLMDFPFISLIKRITK